MSSGRREDLDQKTAKRILRQAGLEESVARERFVAIYLMVIGKTATGYSAHCPDLLGCAAVGNTVEAVVANMKKALDLHFDGLVEGGDPLPKPGGVDLYREMIKDLDLDHNILAHVRIDINRFAPLLSHSWRPILDHRAVNRCPRFEGPHHANNCQVAIQEAGPQWGSCMRARFAHNRLGNRKPIAS